MPAASRTLNPLHFEDLEPKRFEDLVRQLAYEFRLWRKLEATGRSGADDGFDARGWEIVGTSDDDSAEEGDDAERGTGADRLWLIQCKREREIGPKKLVGYLAAVTESERTKLYGLVLAAPCDFSKKARDGFDAKCREFGLAERHLWGKAELEDMLFQPKNDHLLFAYFGISLTIRKRSLRTEVRSRLAMKRKAYRILEGKTWMPVLLRDASESRYPRAEDIPDFHKSPPWAVREFAGFHHSGLRVVSRRYYAYLDDEGASWDAAFAVDQTKVNDRSPWSKRDADAEAASEKAREFWNSLPPQNQAWLDVIGVIPYDSIVDIDELGDGYVEDPHVYSLFNNGRPYSTFYARVESIGPARHRRIIRDDKDGRVEKFPADLRSRLNPKS